MTKELRTNLLLLLASVIATLIAVEFALRAFAPQPVYSALKKIVPSYFTAGTFNTFTLRRNYVGTESSEEFPGRLVTVRTNSLGYRSPEINPAQKTKKRILILGDSYTFGAHVENSETYSAVLQKILTEHGYDYEVINAGYANGWEADEEYCWLVNEGLSLQPDVVVYGMFLGNDIIGIDKSSWVETDEFELPIRIKSKTLFVDEEEGIIRNKKKDFKAVGIEWYYRVPIARESHAFVLFARALSNIMSNVFKPKIDSQIDNYPYPINRAGRADSRLRAELGQKQVEFVKIVRGFDPRAAASTPQFLMKIYYWDYLGDKYPFIAKRKGRADLPLRAGFEEKQLEFIKLVRGMRARAAAAKAQFLVLMLPINFMVEPDVFVPLLSKEGGEEITSDQIELNDDYYSHLAAQLSEMKINYLNIFNEMKLNPQAKYFPRNGEVHFNPQGHKFTAEKLYDFLASRALIQR